MSDNLAVNQNIIPKGSIKMKSTAKTLLILALGIMLIPCLVFFKDKLQNNPANLLTDEVKILSAESGKISTISRKDYLLYSTLAAIPADYSDEALKAQIVLQNTYIAHERLSPEENLNGADLSDDETVYQKILSKEEAKELYKNFDDIKDRLYSLIDEVYDEVLTYDSAPIAVAFFESSFGQTESAEDIWGEEIDYLKSVSCRSDKDIDEISTKISSDDLKKNLETAFDLTLSENYESWIEITKESDADTPLNIEIAGQKQVLASEFYKAVGLPSQHFSVSVSDDTFTFVTKGSGHLVGMSQSYAQSLSDDGKDYKQILKYFFDGCEITTVG